MFCPACKDTVLSMTDRQGIEIDFCPNCRGVWLDRGELDKIIEKSTANTSAMTSSQLTQPTPFSKYNDYESGHKTHKRRKSFLEELFD